jgi:hypothetical protein
MKVVIVGNGENVLEHEYGKLIDSFDVVIRMGQYVIKGFEKHVGKKTDVYSAKWFAWWDKTNQWKTPRKMNLDHMSEIWFQFYDPHTEVKNVSQLTPFEQAYLDFWLHTSFKNSNLMKNMSLAEHHQLLREFHIHEKILIHYSHENLLEMIRLLNFEKNNVFTHSSGGLIEPTTGIKTIQMAMERFPDAEIYVIGYDGFMTGWYWNPDTVPNPKHDYLNEKILLRKWFSSKKIHKLQKLYEHPDVL